MTLLQHTVLYDKHSSDWGFSTETISEFNWGPEAPASAGSTVLHLYYDYTQ